MLVNMWENPTPQDPDCQTTLNDSLATNVGGGHTVVDCAPSISAITQWVDPIKVQESCQHIRPTYPCGGGVQIVSHVNDTHIVPNMGHQHVPANMAENVNIKSDTNYGLSMLKFSGPGYPPFAEAGGLTHLENIYNF